MLYFHGDIHGDILTNFSYNKNPEMRKLTPNDYLIILGDCGVPWNDYTFKEDIYKLNWLNDRPYKTIFITGNHDNYDLIEQMPQISFHQGIARQAVYNNKIYKNIFYIDKPTFLYLNQYDILIIPGADSHDIQDGIIDGTQKDWRKTYKLAKQSGKKFMRVSHVTWWPQEKVQVNLVNQLIKEKNIKYVHFILSHECPANQLWQTNRRFQSNKGQIFLEQIQNTIEYDIWLHGHLHDWINNWRTNTIGLYNDILSEEDCIDMYWSNLKLQQKYEEVKAKYYDN